MRFFSFIINMKLPFLLLSLMLVLCNENYGAAASMDRTSGQGIAKSAVQSSPEIKEILGASSQNVIVSGTAGSKTTYIDFGGHDTYTIHPLITGNVEIRDNQISTINFPEGLSISDAGFLSNGVQFTINDFTIKLIGTPENFLYVFAGNPLNSANGVSRNFMQTAIAFGATVPVSGQSINKATITGIIQGDGSIKTSSPDQSPPSVPSGLAATTTSSSVTLSWTPSSDNVGVTGYNIWRDGILKATAITATWTESSLATSTSYCYRVSAVDAAGNESGISSEICAVTLAGSSASATGKVNDTGITKWSNASANNLETPQNDFPGQDADYGRDKINNDDSDGHAGFKYTKIDSAGNPLPVVAAEWSAVLDNITGLMWEIKTYDGTLHDVDNTYSWYEPDNNINGGTEGAEDGGTCPEGGCDTRRFIRAVNLQKFCGFSDWRLPTLMELSTLLNYGRSDIMIDRLFFPHTQPNKYWSSTPNSISVTSNYLAWYVDFDAHSWSGHMWDNKNSGNYVRLVRGR